MKLISHRGNIKEPTPNRENSPSYIDIALSSGYDVEIDIRFINNKFYLGHDNPEYQVSELWLEKRKTNLWIHCKDLDSATQLSHNVNNFMYFCRTSDPYVLTSNGFIWVHDLNLNISNKTIIPLLGLNDINMFKNKIPYAVCTDYITYCEYNLNSKGLIK
jgi:hypothetical protein